jgi:hypothetical protein
LANSRAFKSKTDCVAVLIGFAKSLVLLTFPSPIIVLSETVPVKTVEFNGAFKSKLAIEVSLMLFA